MHGWSGDHCQYDVKGETGECMPGWLPPRCTKDLDECNNACVFLEFAYILVRNTVLNSISATRSFNFDQSA